MSQIKRLNRQSFESTGPQTFPTLSQQYALVGPVVAHRTFYSEGTDFTAFYACISYLNQWGLSMGAIERNNPIGVYFGDAYIAKWTNIEEQDRQMLDGFIYSAGGMRRGSITIYLRPEVHERLNAIIKSGNEALPWGSI